MTSFILQANAIFRCSTLLFIRLLNYLDLILFQTCLSEEWSGAESERLLTVFIKYEFLLCAFFLLETFALQPRNSLLVGCCPAFLTRG